MSQPAHIPWDRIVHFEGRGTDIPASIALLTCPDASIRAEALDTLRHSLKHQDSLIQATPFGVQALCQAIASGSVIDKPEALGILRTIALAARLHMAGSQASGPSLTLSDLIDSSRLWPPFVSEEEDESLWEEWAESEGEFVAYHVLTAEVLVEHRSAIEALRSDDKETADAAARLLSVVNGLSNELQRQRAPAPVPLNAAPTQDESAIKKRWWWPFGK
ncbi:MAG: hypothetical protein NTW19_06100 [Planctomycetota bacterium]|nr:hypothetical protein [Planctomycetota bacterium]